MGTRKLGAYALLKATYTRLTNHASTSSYSTYNNVPDNAEMPFIRIGDVTGVRSAKISNDDTEGEENSITIHVWSDSLSDKEASQMMDNVVQAMTSSSLSITGYTPVLFFFDSSSLIIDDTEPAHIVRHGWMRFVCHMA